MLLLTLIVKLQLHDPQTTIYLLLDLGKAPQPMQTKIQNNMVFVKSG